MDDEWNFPQSTRNFLLSQLSNDRLWSDKFDYLSEKVEKWMIEHKKIYTEDSLEVTRMKDEFNRYAMQMKVGWNELSYEERKELYDKLRKAKDELAQFE